MTEQLKIYILSDSLGETAQYVARAAATQFSAKKIEYKHIPYVNDRDYLREVLDRIDPKDSILVYTLVVKALSDEVVAYCQRRGIVAVDILEPVFQAIAGLTGDEPVRKPGLSRQMDAQYFNKIDAVEFAIKYDDGKDAQGLLQADLVILGVSRTSKTPLSMYLAYRGIKVANIPLVPEVAVSEKLFTIPREKVIGLTIKPQVLHQIREERMRGLGVKGQAEYANMARILDELDYAEGIMKRVGCPIIDVSHKAIEETANKVLQIYYRGDNFSE